MRQPSSSPLSGRLPASRFFSLVLTALSLAGVGAFAPACGSGPAATTGGSGGGGGAGGTVDPGDCKDGVIVNGVCEGKCTKDKCLLGNICVENRCVLPCDSHKDCFLDGSQNCTPAK